jgi:hypothetical protein
MFADKEGSSPTLCLTSGVLKETLSGVHSRVVNPGISKYSLNVLDTDSTYFAIKLSILSLYIFFI